MEQNKQTSQTEPRWEPKKSKGSALLFLLVIISAVLGVLYFWKLPPFAMDMVHTNNAYVRGQTTLLSPKVAGYVQQVLVQDFQTVEKGQPLVQIDPAPYQAKVAQAKANLLAQQAMLEKLPQSRQSLKSALKMRQAAIESANSQLNLSEIELKRMATLYKTNSASKREVDQATNASRQAQANLQQANAQLQIAQQDLAALEANEKNLQATIESAKAMVELAEQDLHNTVVYAPESGKLSQIGVKQGQLVSVGTQLMFLVPDERWVIANFKEADTFHIHLGQLATVSVDALNGKRFHGKVSEISPATASEFSLIKADSGTGNFVKIAQRIPIKIEFESEQEDLKLITPGMSVEVEIKF